MSSDPAIVTAEADDKYTADIATEGEYEDRTDDGEHRVGRSCEMEIKLMELCGGRWRRVGSWRPEVAVDTGNSSHEATATAAV